MNRSIISFYPWIMLAYLNLLVYVSGCSSEGQSSQDPSIQAQNQEDPLDMEVLSRGNEDQDPTEDQVKGNPEKGFDLLVNSGYVSCGIPEALSNLLPLGDEKSRIEGRNELNQDMPYFFTKYEAQSGVKLLVGYDPKNLEYHHPFYFHRQGPI